MANRAANKIKQRRERLKENQSPVVAPKPRLVWFWVLAAVSISIIGYLSYLAYTSDLTNELVILIIAAVTVLILLIIWYLPKLYVRSLPIETGKDFDREKERLKLEDDTRKTFAQIIGGIVLFSGLIFTYNTYRIQVEQTRLQIKQQEINQEGQFTDRFTKAVAQLGDAKLEIRLGGMYALERIAKDSPKDHWTVMEILSAYIRENAKKEEPAKKVGSSKNANNIVDEAKKNAKVTTDIQAALTIIRRRKIEQDSIADAIDLSEAYLISANLSEASLGGVNLSLAYLGGVNLSLADLNGANLSGAKLWEADLGGADLSGANLSLANLSKANLDGANLNGADLRLTVLLETNLSGAHLSFVENLTFERLSQAIINKNTKLPDNLESRKAELLEISKKNLEKSEKILNETNKQ